MGVKNEKLQYFWGSLKIQIFKGRGGSRKNQYKVGSCLKGGGGLGHFADLRGGGVDTSMHTMK